VTSESHKLGARERLSESVGQLMVGVDVLHVDLIAVSEISHVMKAEIDMATAFEIDGMFRLLNTCSVVFVDDSWTRFGVAEFIKKHTCVHKGTGRFKRRIVLCFCWGESWGFLEG
jgi:hypothetical protein